MEVIQLSSEIIRKNYEGIANGCQIVSVFIEKLLRCSVRVIIHEEQCKVDVVISYN